MGAETKNDCPFCAENARARREAFERDELPELKKRREAVETLHASYDNEKWAG